MIAYAPEPAYDYEREKHESIGDYCDALEVGFLEDLDANTLSDQAARFDGVDQEFWRLLVEAHKASTTDQGLLVIQKIQSLTRTLAEQVIAREWEKDQCQSWTGRDD